jgi:hypothetical protein
MRALAGWIAGIFGLGLAVGSIVFGTSAMNGHKGEELASSAAPIVECGEGREAIVEQVVADGETVARIRCRAIEQTRTTVPTPRREAPVRAVEVAPASTPAATTPSREQTPETETSSRSAKDSALIIGGAAGAGAGIGAIAGGKKGAALGAAIGGVTGTVYDLSTRKKK